MDLSLQTLKNGKKIMTILTLSHDMLKMYSKAVLHTSILNKYVGIY